MIYRRSQKARDIYLRHQPFSVPFLSTVRSGKEKGPLVLSLHQVGPLTFFKTQQLQVDQGLLFIEASRS